MEKRKTLSLIFSLVATAGVVGTTISAIKATPKALALIEEEKKKRLDEGDPSELTRKDVVAVCWKCYISTAAIGTSTILCIWFANGVNRKYVASLASAYAVLSKSYDDYQNQVKKFAGEEIHEKVLSTLVKEPCEKVHLYAPTLTGEACIDIGTDVNPEELCTFYDQYSERYFESTAARVIQAEYHLNRNYVLGGQVTLNEFYSFLGLEGVEIGDYVGWDVSDEILWIDFNHMSANIDDGTPDGVEVYIIEMVFGPVPLDR